MKLVDLLTGIVGRLAKLAAAPGLPRAYQAEVKALGVLVNEAARYPGVSTLPLPPSPTPVKP